MSIRLMSLIFESNLPTSEKIIMLAMADYASDSGESIFPSIATISRKTSLSESGVHNLIRSLLHKKYLILVGKGGGRKTNLYKINVELLTNEGCTTYTPPLHQVDPTPAPGTPNPLLNQEINNNGATPQNGELPILEPPIPLTPSKGKAENLNQDHYPLETRETINTICQLWKLTAPHGRGIGVWTKGARNLLEAEGEFGNSILYAIHQEYQDYIQKHGKPPYVVAGPFSLVNVARAMAGRMRQDQSNPAPVWEGVGFYG